VGYRLEVEEMSDRWDRAVSGREREGCTPSGKYPGGPWAGSKTGPERCPAAFYIIMFCLDPFPFSFFEIPISFIAFANQLQIHSNQN
jgi:hypothetical protein